MMCLAIKSSDDLANPCLSFFPGRKFYKYIHLYVMSRCSSFATKVNHKISPTIIIYMLELIAVDYRRALQALVILYVFR